MSAGKLLFAVQTAVNAVFLIRQFEAVRQFLFPLGTLAILRLLGTDLLTLQISVVLTGMPVGSSTAFLADKYGADAVFASKCVFISTLTSLITIPILTIFF